MCAPIKTETCYLSYENVSFFSFIHSSFLPHYVSSIFFTLKYLVQMRKTSHKFNFKSLLINHKTAPPTICSFLMFLQRHNNYIAIYMIVGILPLTFPLNIPSTIFTCPYPDPKLLNSEHENSEIHNAEVSDI